MKNTLSVPLMPKTSFVNCHLKGLSAREVSYISTSTVEISMLSDCSTKATVSPSVGFVTLKNSVTTSPSLISRSCATYIPPLFRIVVVLVVTKFTV